MVGLVTSLRTNLQEAKQDLKKPALRLAALDFRKLPLALPSQYLFYRVATSAASLG